jgi:hypothetical protein
MIPSANVIKHFYADNNSRLTSMDILMVWRLSNAEFIDLTGTGCDLKYDKNIQPSFRAFFNDIVSTCG